MNLNENDINARDDELTLEERIAILEEQYFDLSQLLIRQDYQLTATQVILKTLLLVLCEQDAALSDKIRKNALTHLARLADGNHDILDEFGEVVEMFFPEQHKQD
ncbi:TPA: hypothetical protein RNX65_001400 [Pasteurella multocida]|nr:hypothetical protein [Pasteurella multocida]